MNKKNDADKIRKNFVLIFSVFAITIIGSIAYAYFSAILSNVNNEKAEAKAATIALRFSDNDSGISANLNLGESVTKKFTLENTGTTDTYAKINWYNLMNTYTQNSLTYILEQSETEDGSYIIISQGKVPISEVEIIKPLKNGILVPSRAKYYYKLTITLNSLNINQNSDINAKMHTHFNLEEGTFTGVDKLLKLVEGADSSSLDVITKEPPVGATCTNTLAYDGTVDNNLRYVGANPCNYVKFNGELWRIIGVMMGVDDGNGILESRIKIIRNDALGNYSWDTSARTINSGYGINDWTQADLMRELNGDYLDTSLTANTNWYNGENNAKTAVFDYTKRLNTSAQEKIGNAKWKLGGQGANAFSVEGEGTAAKLYIYEKGNDVFGSKSGQICNDNYCPRKTQWTGKIALMYPSDYGFAVGGEVRNTCLMENLNKYQYSNGCYPNNWLFSTANQWLLYPASYNSSIAYSINYLGAVKDNYILHKLSVKPVTYLKVDVGIFTGNGSIENPYILS